MKPHRVTIAALALGTLVVAAPTAAADERRRQEPEPRPTKLWRLYPLDPEADERPGDDVAGSGRGPRLESDASKRSLPRMEGKLTGMLRDEGPPAPSWALGLLGASSIATMAWLLLRRRRAGPSPASFEEVSVPAALNGSGHQEEDLVRLHLRNGRIVQGRLRQPLTDDSRVILVDVVSAFEPGGRRARPEPTDAFILAAEVRRIETPGQDVTVEASSMSNAQGDPHHREEGGSGDAFDPGGDRQQDLHDPVREGLQEGGSR